MTTDKGRWMIDCSELASRIEKGELTSAEQIHHWGKLYDEAFLDGRIHQGDLHLSRLESCWTDDARVDEAREVRQETYLYPVDVEQ